MDKDFQHSLTLLKEVNGIVLHPDKVLFKGSCSDIECKRLHQVYRMKPCIYDVCCEFKMNSEFAAEADSNPNLWSYSKKKRKRKLESSNKALLDEEDQKIESLCSIAINSAKEHGLFQYEPSVNDNNVSARSAVQSLGCGDLLRDISQVAASVDTVSFKTLYTDAAMDLRELFNTVISNGSGHCLVLKTHGREFLLPINTEFIMCDFLQLPPLDQIIDHGFDFIVLDPPWENKSVKRKRTYSTLPNEELEKLPISRISSENAVLAIWVTNKRTHLEFIRQRLLAVWGYTLVSMWYWCKVTRSGKYVTKFNRNGKKPYELVCLATRHSNKHLSKALEDPKVILSTPSLIHSAKPNLREVFDQFLPENARCLELFARNLHPGFLSVGNEVLRNQDMEYFEILND